ncbi:hypothetical protein [Cytobacillus purgationiresistens]|uniref:Uncharacterized protein n=1 Tax=Cytobacillus purgationiresistens TaxID=863449 RepID=A0ABU0ALP0_9BACI|nr:hypothetical protein [Cytobacillus purgationiresistens]MDQ0272184.1 hypothetical protein [Cytobacillus purgationiresistens]
MNSKENENKKVNVTKDIAKGIVKGLKTGSVLDKDLNEASVYNINPKVSSKDLLKHFTGQKILTKEQQEEMKKQIKINKSLGKL